MPTMKKGALEGVSSKDLASQYGVSVRTAQRWKKTGRLPKSRTADKPSKRDLTLSSEDLATQFGVSRRTAQRWKKASGTTSKRKRAPKKRKFSKKLIVPPTDAREYVGDISRGIQYTIDLANEELSNAVIGGLIAWGEGLPKSRNPTTDYQFIAIGNAILNPDESTPGSARAVPKAQYKGGKTEWEVVIASGLRRSKKAALRSFRQELTAHLTVGVMLTSAIMYARRPATTLKGGR